MILPKDAFRPATPDVLNDVVDGRDPKKYLLVAKQFDVELTDRYQPRDGHTFCNIYVWDVTCAMGAQIPHWVNPETGAPTPCGKGVELSADSVVDWLEKHGHEFGWSEVNATGAMFYASKGQPAVAVWKNPDPRHSGHVAMVLPSGDGKMMIAQAGAHNYFNVPLEKGFGSIKPRCFVHD